MKEHKNFWDKNAGRYDRFMRKDRAAYEEMYKLIRPVVKAKTVLELATGTGLIAKNIVNAAAHIEATDASAEMIAEAKRDKRSAKLHFSVQDMFRLPYADKSFNVVIVSNALHIVPQPEKALQEIKRVLKDDGVLIAPTFTHAENSFTGKVRAFFMKRVGFPLHSKWTSEEYLRFLRQNGWTVVETAFPGQIECCTAVSYGGQMNVTFERGEKKPLVCMLYTIEVDSNFQKVFSVQLTEGNWRQLFRQKNAVVLSRSAARRIFGKQNPVGKVFHPNKLTRRSERNYTPEELAAIDYVCRMPRIIATIRPEREV